MFELWRETRPEQCQSDVGLATSVGVRDASEMSRLDIPAHLDRVSRSFAFCIARLDSPMRDQVGLSYLLCRILDTIEDSTWLETDAQLESFDLFLHNLHHAGSGEAVVPASVQAFTFEILNRTTGISDSEQRLLKDTALVFERLQSFTPDVRDVIVSSVVSMGQGMRSFVVRRNSNEGLLVLKDLADVNRYCFFVAGVVGEILCGLLRIAGINRGLKVESSLGDGFRFGLFLQKVNILKDRKGDIEQGRDLVPDVPTVFRSALSDAEKALRYLTSIPHEFESYRLFCAWSFFLGMASLPHIWRGRKIGRMETVALLAQVEMNVGSNEKLIRMFKFKHEPWLKEFRDAFQVELKDVAATRLETYREFYVGRARDEEIAAGVNVKFA